MEPWRLASAVGTSPEAARRLISRVVRLQRRKDQAHSPYVRGSMEQRITWPATHLEDPTPFTLGPKQRPLRLTFDSTTLRQARGQDQEALSLLAELASEPELDVVDFGGSTHPAISVDPQPTNGYYNITIYNSRGNAVYHHIGIHSSRVSEEVIRSIFALAPQDASFPEASQNLISLEAHTALDRDVFVTLSPLILASRGSFPLSNPLSPVEASRLAGLVLRTRANWLFRHPGSVRITTDRGMFYWVLMRTKLPAFWRYFSAILAARQHHDERLARVAQSILEKCFRSLQARDEIAVQFYLPQGNTSRDTMMYHFDYLTLLIAGAYDGLASIVDAVHSLGTQPIHQSFRREPFLTALRSRGMSTLVQLATRSQTRDLMVMLHSLRNTIHSAGLGTLAHSEAGRPQRSYARVPPDFRDELLDAAARLGGADQWGIWREDFTIRDEAGADRPAYEVYVEPFTYAVQLVDQWFPLLDGVAASTDVDRLFPSGAPADLLREIPPDWSDMVPYFVLMGR